MMQDPNTALSQFSGYQVHRLMPSDAPRLQFLYERCNDFNQFCDGADAQSDAGLAAFSDVPNGFSPEQLRIYGLVDSAGERQGVMQVLLEYPRADVCWLGLLLLAPRARRQGLGKQLVD